MPLGDKTRMTPPTSIRALATRLALAAVLCISPSWSAAEPVFVAPDGPVPIGGFADVEIQGLEDKSNLAVETVPEIRYRAYAALGTGNPIIALPTNQAGTWTLVIGWVEDGKPKLKKIPLTVGTGPIVVPPPVNPPPVVVPPTTKALAATFVYEKDSHAIPVGVLAALNKLNRERGIVATVLEADTTDGTGEVPEQYRVALAAAKEAGLPCLVVTGLAGVIRVVKSPTTEQAVLDAVPLPPAMRKAG